MNFSRPEFHLTELHGHSLDSVPSYYRLEALNLIGDYFAEIGGKTTYYYLPEIKILVCDSFMGCVEIYYFYENDDVDGIKTVSCLLNRLPETIEKLKERVL